MRKYIVWKLNGSEPCLHFRKDHVIADDDPHRVRPPFAINWLPRMRWYLVTNWERLVDCLSHFVLVIVIRICPTPWSQNVRHCLSWSSPSSSPTSTFLSMRHFPVMPFALHSKECWLYSPDVGYLFSLWINLYQCGDSSLFSSSLIFISPMLIFGTSYMQGGLYFSLIIIVSIFNLV